MIRLLSVTLASGLLLAANGPQGAAPTDTGSMFVPPPVAGSGINVPAGSTTSGTDTGSMAVPESGKGFKVAPRTTPDTGSMAEPSSK